MTHTGSFILLYQNCAAWPCRERQLDEAPNCVRARGFVRMLLSPMFGWSRRLIATCSLYHRTQSRRPAEGLTFAIFSLAACADARRYRLGRFVGFGAGCFRRNSRSALHSVARSLGTLRRTPG